MKLKSVLQTQRGMSVADLRLMAKNEPEAFMRKFQAGVDAGKFQLAHITDIKNLWRALADVNVAVQMPDISGSVRTVTTSAFPIMTGSLVIAAVNAAYLDIDPVTQNLVTELDDSAKITTIGRISSLDKDVDEVKELEEFPEISSTEDKVEIRHRKNGRKLTLSAEAIMENRLPDFLMRVNDLGRMIARRIEDLTLKRITDYDGSQTTPAEPYVYRPNGTGTAIYSATANTPGTRAPSGTRINSNALVDETDLEAARIRLNTMLDDNGKRIGAPPRSRTNILVPDALIDKLAKILNSEYVPGVENEVSNWGPGARFNIPSANVISTPLLDDLSASAWYYGAFKDQFIRKWKMRFEYMSLGQETQAYLNSQVAAQYRIAWDCEVGARDYVSVIQCLSGTTAPADE